MILSKISPICKKSRKFDLREDASGRQWLGNGLAYYRLYDLPYHFSLGQLFDLAGIDNDARQKYAEKEDMLLPVEDSADRIRAHASLFVTYSITEYLCLIAEEKTTVLLPVVYLSPLTLLEKRFSGYNFEWQITRDSKGQQWAILGAAGRAYAVIQADPIIADVCFVDRLQKTVEAIVCEHRNHNDESQLFALSDLAGEEVTS